MKYLFLLLLISCSSSKYTFNYYGKMISCTEYNTGDVSKTIYLSDCNDGNEYVNVVNIKKEKQ